MTTPSCTCGTAEADTHDKALASIWRQFDLDHPADFKGRSLSVSDVVLLDEDTLFYCQSVGWQKLTPGSMRRPVLTHREGARCVRSLHASDRTMTRGHPAPRSTQGHHNELSLPSAKAPLNGGRLIAPPGTYLTDDQIRRVAPSVFADAPHEFRSERFSVIPTSQIVTGLRKEGFNVVQVSQAKTRDASRTDFTKHMLRLRRSTPNRIARLGTFSQVVLVNANDGSSSYILSAGLFRLICLNGMTVSEREAASVRVTHMGTRGPQGNRRLVYRAGRLPEGD